jgi:sulfotransferase family protein
VNQPEVEPRAAGAASGRLPDFVIVGAMKAGTTSIRAYLDAHPAVFAPPETHFFSKHFEEGLDWYRAQFAGAGAATVVGDKTPNYMYSDEIVARMASAIPAAKLIAILRNPIDRAYSHYWHHRRVDKESRSFDEAIAAELDGSQEHSFDYVEYGRYIHHIERLMRFYPREQLLVLLFEDLEARPAEVFAETCRFLGVDDGFLPSIVGERTNTYRVVRAKRLWDAARRRQMWWLVRLLKPILVRGAAYEPMSPATRAKLAEAFAEDNDRLAAWFGRDLSIWKN